MMQDKKINAVEEQETIMAELQIMEEAETMSVKVEPVEDFHSKPHSRHERHLYPSSESLDSNRPKRTSKDRRYIPSIKRSDKNKVHGKGKKPYKAEKLNPLP